MTNKKTTKRALLVSLVSMLLCFAMLLGTTFAWFTDSASSANNVIKAGNLDIEVEYTLDGENWAKLDDAENLFQKGLWEPGHTEVAALKITNAGSLALKYAVNMNVTSETVGKTKDGKDIVLSEILTVSALWCQYDDGIIGQLLMGGYFGSDDPNNTYYNTASFKASNVLGSDIELVPGYAHYFIVKVDMPEGVGNEANHDGVNIPEINFGINVIATQLAYEEDSFGKDYDAGATYPDMVFSAAELVEALSNGENVVLSDSYTLEANGSNAYGKTALTVLNGQTIDGNGKTLSVTGANGTWDSAINTTGGTIKNLTIDSGFRGIFINHNSANAGKVYLENVVIDGPVYTISCDQGTNNGLEAKNSTFNGWTSYAATIGDVLFTDCSFGEGAGYAYCRPYAVTKFVGCNFEAGYEIDPRAAVTFENCTIDGVPLTAENLADLVTSNIANATVIG